MSSVLSLPVPFVIKEFAAHSRAFGHTVAMNSGIPFLEAIIRLKPYSYNRRACCRKDSSDSPWNERDAKCI